MKKFISFLLIVTSCFVYGQMPQSLSSEEKIYGLSKFWQEVNYNFVYLDKVDREKWDAEYRKLITEVQKTESDYEYYRLLQKFCAELKDGHTNVYFPENISENITQNHFGDYRLFFTNIEGKAIVTGVDSAKKEELPIGTEVVKVNGLPTSDYLKKFVTPYLASSTAYILEDKSVATMLSAPIGTRHKIDFKLPSGEIKNIILTNAPATREEVFPPVEKQELLEFKWLENKMAYLALNSFGYPEINAQFLQKLPELYQAKSLIIDLRKNGGGNTDIGRQILEYLTQDSLLYGSKSLSRLHNPVYKAWGAWTNEQDTIGDAWAKQSYLSYRDQFYFEFPYSPHKVTLTEKRIIVPTVILTGHNTASAAEDFLIYADNQQHMLKIGEPTYGSTGQPLMFDLPGGGHARICTKKDIYPDGREFVGYGIQPDILVKKSVSDYLNNTDPVLDKAVDYLKGQILKL